VENCQQFILHSHATIHHEPWHNAEVSKSETKYRPDAHKNRKIGVSSLSRIFPNLFIGIFFNCLIAWKSQKVRKPEKLRIHKTNKQRTMLTERPPVGDEVSVNFRG
jgi:hypothetical protein